MNWEDSIVEASATDTGMRRSNNQDSYAIVRAPSREVWKSRGHLFMVADGMGAHAVGELASKLACDNVPHTYLKTRNAESSDAITKAFQEVARLIHSRATANKDFTGMGTTCSALVLSPEGALIAHVGDSRVYRIRGGDIGQYSFDHSLAWELVRRNHLTPEQANKAVPRNVITRSLGSEPTVEVDIEGPLSVQPEDVFVICSDGLSGPVANEEIGAIAANFHPSDAVRYLLHLANLRGGNDNITLIIVRVGEWIDPEAKNGTPNETHLTKPQRRGSLFTNLLAGLQKKSPSHVEDEPYTLTTAPVSDELVGRISDLVRDTQALAVEQAWPLDWPELARVRREAEDTRSDGRLRSSLRQLGEAVVLLGEGGRVYRKEHGIL